ncbi:MAG: histidine phosphatase family protein [Micrococcales bacterium]|nr:histidine phosphatase family protein [Micrococcales bacterium]
MPVTVHLVRHGESTWNRDGILQGQTPHPELTDTGRAQAAAAGERLAGLIAAEACAIWTSDLVRARQTAALIAGHLGGTPQVTDALREQGLGSLEGRRPSELHPEPVPEGRHISEVRWGGGESVQDVHARVSRFVAARRAEQSALAPHLVLVTHGDTLRVIRALLQGRSHREVDWADEVANGCVVGLPL